MLVFIENTPRDYAWGSRDALAELLGTSPTGEPQAELWLGAHPGGPATVAKAVPGARTLIDLIESDPERYGVDGAQLPFLLKVLAIGAPLSLQVHPDRAQAEAGFAAEEAAGVPRDARERNYGDPNHKPELLVALSEVAALSGFRPIADARRELAALAEAAGGSAALHRAAELCGARWADAGAAADGADRERADRRAYVEWALGGSDEAARAVCEIAAAVQAPSAELGGRIDRERLSVLRRLTVAYPDDPGVLVSLLLHLVRLEPGQAIYLGARQLHAYLGGIAVEVMASSDNVLRAGFTEKYVDADEVLAVVDFSELDDPRFPERAVGPGLIEWAPGVPDFRLLRARLHDPAESESVPRGDDRAELVELAADYPLVLIVTSGRVRVERPSAEFDEVASVARGQSLYVSAGAPIELSGRGEAFIATVGRAAA
ncbi:MAG: mannose-6-phosphate isomerase, class I [Leucobacter sp.]|nr:mannose-6-phosphate isomerase, class I [Leucobacter sp.]